MIARFVVESRWRGQIPLDELLFESFLEGLQETSTAPESAEERGRISKLLVKAWNASTDEWPKISLEPEIYARWVAGCCAAEPGLVAQLEALRASEIYLTYACARGDHRAIETLEEHYFPTVDWTIRRLQLPPEVADDLKQDLREDLFVLSGNATFPLIAKYSGRGPLSSWLKTITRRMGGRRFRSKDREIPSGDDVLTDIQPDVDEGELLQMRKLYSKEFHAAFAEAVRSLDERSRRVLRMHFVQKKSIDEIGEHFSTHRATAARWVQKSKLELISEVRLTMLKRFQLQDGDTFQSLLRFVSGRIDMTFNQVFGEATLASSAINGGDR